MSGIVTAIADNAMQFRGWRGWAAKRSLARPLLEAEAESIVEDAIRRMMAQSAIESASNDL